MSKIVIETVRNGQKISLKTEATSKKDIANAIVVLAMEAVKDIPDVEATPQDLLWQIIGHLDEMEGKNEEELKDLREARDGKD